MPTPTPFTTLLVSLPLLATSLFAQQSLQTTFQGGAGNYVSSFDLNVTASAITLTGFEVNVGGTGGVDIYRRNGTRLGNQLSPAGWTTFASTTVSGAIAGVPTKVSFEPTTLRQGITGITVACVQPTPGSATIYQPFTSATYSPATVADEFLTILCGELMASLFAPPLVPNWVPNVRLSYLVGELCPLPAHNGIYNGFSRGFNFTAATPFCIRQLMVPPDAKQAGDTASYLVRINGAVAFRSVGNTGAVSPNLNVQIGDVVDVIANWSPTNPSPTTAHNSYTPTVTSQLALIQGVQHVLRRTGWQYDIGSPNWASGSYLTPAAGPIGRVHMTTEPIAPAATATLGAGCGQQFGSIYEMMTPAAFDLANSALAFTLHSTGGETVTRAGALLPVGSVATPVVLPLADDDQITVPFTTGYFPGWSAMTICSNGIVSEATGNPTGYQPSVAALLAAPQTAFWCWHDFNPAAGTGRVKVEQSPIVTVITWDGVQTFGYSAPTTLQFQLYATGDVVIAFGSVADTSASPYLVGFSPHGASADPGPTDLSSIPAAGVYLQYPEAGPLSLTANNAPVVGTPWNLTLSNVPSTTQFGVDVVGFSDPGLADLTALGMPGCGLRASLDLLNPWLYSGNPRTFSLGVPPLALLGANVYVTEAVFQKPAMNAFGAVTSNGVRGTIGTN